MESIEVESKYYFNDNKRRIDYILVYDNSTIDYEQLEHIKTFISNLERKGLHFETAEGIRDPNLTFVKIHGPRHVLTIYAETFNIQLACDSEHYKIDDSTTKWEFMRTELSDYSSRTFARAIKSLNGKKPSRISTTERTMVINRLLNNTYFCPMQLDYGIENLISKNTFLAAYPLHSGDWIWTEDGPLNKLQLLAEFWAHIGMWYKHQPLNLIERYFGPEVAVYFAFCGFYNKMLIIASFVGVLCVVYGIVSTYNWNYNIIKEVCTSSLKLCPSYFSYGFKGYYYLYQSCDHTKAMCVFDNNGTTFFGLFMGFWAVTFVHLWKRYYAKLSVHWNIQSDKDVEDISQEGQESYYLRMQSSQTDASDTHIPTAIVAKNRGVTVVVCALMMLIVLCSVFATILYRLRVTFYIRSSKDSVLHKHINVLMMTTASFFIVIFMKIFGTWYRKISLWLTKREYHKTQEEFDKSYIHKHFLLSFVNSYAMMMYISFIKGSLYTYPGDINYSWLMMQLRADVCHPAGCIMGVCIQLAFVMLFKSLIGNIWNAAVSVYKTHINLEESRDLPKWERDYQLQPVGRYFLVSEYMELVIQYGFVTFFAAAFPLAPLCALISNILEVRGDANKYVRKCRRPIPVQKVPMTVWKNLLQMMSNLSIISNAFVLAFTSSFVERQLYRYGKDFWFNGYINSTLSVFNPKDLKGNSGYTENCYYSGKRYPPGADRQYQLSYNYWFELCIKFIVAAIFEHLLLMFTGILRSMLPDLPEKKTTYNKLKEGQAITNIPRGTNIFYQ